MKALLLVALAGLMTAMPASAQDACPDGQTETPEGCSQQAWVDDCPPDMMCAAAVEEPQDDGPTYTDCGGEVCAYDEPIEYGDGDPWDTGMGPTCMDGSAPDGACDDEVLYLTPGGSGTEADPAYQDAVEDGKDASLAVHAILALALVAGASVVRRRA